MKRVQHEKKSSNIKGSFSSEKVLHLGSRDAMLSPPFVSFLEFHPNSFTFDPTT